MRRAVIVFLLYLISNSLLSQINYNWIIPIDQTPNSFQLVPVSDNKFIINSGYFLDNIVTSGIIYIDGYNFSIQSFKGYVPSRGGLHYYDNKLYAITSLEFPEKRIYNGEINNESYKDTVSVTSNSDFFQLYTVSTN